MGAQIKTGEVKGITAGTWNYKVVANGGTAALNYKIANEPLSEVASTAVSADTGLSIDLPTCQVTVTLTGAAEIYLSKVNGSK